MIHRRLDTYDPARSSLRSWVYGVCSRVASDYRRRHPNRHEASDESLLRAAVEAPQEAELERGRAWQQLSRVLDGMEAAKREVFVLYELEAWSMNEIVASLDCPLQTGYARLRAARKLVLHAFGASEEE